MPPSRLSRPGWKILGGLLLLAGLWFGVPRLLGGLAFFRVHHVEVRGLVNLRAEDVASHLPIGDRRSIFSDLAPLEAAVDTMSGVSTVSVGRRLPGTIVVTVTETEPVAYVMRSGALRMMDEAGKVLPFDPTVAGPDLPIASEGDSLVGRLLARLRRADATFFSTVVRSERVGDDVVVTADGKRYWFRPGAGTEVIRSVMAVVEDLERRQRAWAELDARFAGQIVVRRGSA